MLLLSVSLLALSVVSIWIHEISLRDSMDAARSRVLAQDLAQVVRSISALPPDRRDAVARELSTPRLEVHWRADAPPADDAPVPSGLADLREQIRMLSGSSSVRLGWSDADQHLLVGDFPLAVGGQLSFLAPRFQVWSGVAVDAASFAALAGVALAIGLISIVVVRRLTNPLRVLASAADRIGHDATPLRLLEDGPAEVRRAVRAFNAMQDRIRDLLQDRLQALAAVGHDLRTPLARLRLRAGFLEDAETRHKMEVDLDEMERLVTATLAYLREGRDGEAARPADLVAVVRTICEAASDAGADVDVDATGSLIVPLKVTAVRRAVANLIDNAVIHGRSRVNVSVRVVGRDAIVEIGDRGPGIPEHQLAHVTDPFVRLDPSRNTQTGGVGLGLAIAHKAIEGNGGSLMLENRRGGGLAVRVSLPIP